MLRLQLPQVTITASLNSCPTKNSAYIEKTIHSPMKSSHDWKRQTRPRPHPPDGQLFQTPRPLPTLHFQVHSFLACVTISPTGYQTSTFPPMMDCFQHCAHSLPGKASPLSRHPESPSPTQITPQKKKLATRQEP